MKQETRKSTALRPKIRILIGAVVAIGPGKADLLEAIGRTGSISAAGREMGMSYRRAWMLVDAMNQAFKSPVVETLTGGQRGGGARLTTLGDQILSTYRHIETRAGKAVSGDLVKFARLMRRS